MVKGRYLSIERLEKLLDVIVDQELDVEVWIPEPVLWEWAEHLFSTVQEARAAYGTALKYAREAEISLSRDVDQDGLDGDVEWFVERLQKALDGRAQVRVLRLKDHPDAAALGLRDQVLLVGVGERIHGAGTVSVKTGASDSASMRLVAAAAGARPTDVVVVSNDSDVAKHFAAGARPVIVPSLWDAQGSLLALKPGSEAVAEQAETAIRYVLTSGDGVTAGASFQYGSAFVSLTWSSRSDYLSEESIVSSIDAVGTVTVIEASATERYAVAEATVTVTVETTKTWWDDKIDHLHTEISYTSDVEAIAQVLAERVDDEWVVSVDNIYTE